MSKKQEYEVLSGKLDAFYETGTEGVIWSFDEDGKYGYDGLHCLEKGDIIKVFNDASRKQVIFEGVIDLEYASRRRAFLLNPQYSGQEVFGYWVRGLQKGVDPETWARMFFDGKPAQLVRPKKPAPPQP